MKKLAIIGASTGQLPLCRKAKEMGLTTYCFAYEKGAVCKNEVDHFYPISIYEKDRIVAVCKELEIDGVVSNGSDSTAEIVAYVAEQLSLIGPAYQSLVFLHNKYNARKLTETIPQLSTPAYYLYDGTDKNIYPCVVKPCVGGSKKGVSYVANPGTFEKAIQYATTEEDTNILIEEFIEGKELSVESISYKGVHYVLQITDKDSSSAPHFVELGHHQPACIPPEIQSKINTIVPQILSAIGYDNGASHIELKYNSDNLYLIEVNLRGGGDCISNLLVYKSSGHDYLKYMIEVALGQFSEPSATTNTSYAGIYYLCKQTAHLLPFFKEAEGKEWVVEKEIYSTDLKESHSNYERNGYLIYQSDHKITPNNK